MALANVRGREPLGGGGLVKEELRRTKIDAKRYRVGWTRLHAGRRKRRVAALVAEANARSQGREAGLGVVDTTTTRDQTTTRRLLPRDVLEGRV